MSASTLCRLCGKSTKDYIDIFDENGVKKDLSVKASSCLNINVYPNDVLPKIMCVACCARLDDLYEFFERSTKVQLILRTLYQSSGAISVVRAEHDYAIKIPSETWFPVPQSLLKEEYNVPLPNCIEDEQGRTKVETLCENRNGTDFAEETDPEDASEEPMLLDNGSDGDFNREMEHNYFLPSPESRENGNRIEFNQETEHNYYVRLDRTFRETRNRTDTIREPELNNGFQDPTLSQILEGYPWSCTVCEDCNDSRDRNEIKHEKEQFFQCCPFKGEDTSQRSFVRNCKLEKAPIEYPSKDCGKKSIQKTILRSRRKFDGTKKLCSGQKRIDHDVEQFFICSPCEKPHRDSKRSIGNKNLDMGLRDYALDISDESSNLLAPNFSSHEETINFRCSSCKRCFKTARISRERHNDHCDEKPIRCDILERSHLTHQSQACTHISTYGWKVRVKKSIILETLEVNKDDKYPRPKCKQNFVHWPDSHKR